MSEKHFGWNISAAADDEVRIDLFDAIGAPGQSLQDFTRDLARVKGKRLAVAIHSSGGNLLDALGIYALLRDWKAPVRTYATLAASAASVVFEAGDTRQISPTGSIFVHMPSMGDISGNLDDFDAATRALGAMTNTLAGIYVQHAGGSLEGWLDLMRKETWFTGEQAVSVGLADEVIDERRSVASPTLAAQVKEGVMQARRELIAAELTKALR